MRLTDTLMTAGACNIRTGKKSKEAAQHFAFLQEAKVSFIRV